jgi:3-oxoacyl-[acyl-carrier-protein] synthase I
VISLADLPISKEHLDVVCLGSAGVMEAAIRAQRLLASSALDRVIILGVDSYLEPMSLNWLIEQGRLKSPDNPAGLQPGEAAACFMLESNQNTAVGTNGSVILTGVSVGFEERNLVSRQPSNGIALGRVIDDALVRAENHTLPFAGDWIVDLNGENWKAAELASARLRLQDKLSSTARLIFPAESVGDTGAAAAAIGVCVGVKSLLRSYSRGNSILLTATTDHGHVGAATLVRT